jgi:N-acetylmuramic acid 6-phosphate etherase
MNHSTTESISPYTDLDSATALQIVQYMNVEDRTVADSVAKALVPISILVEAIVEHMFLGGRLFYIGAGTSGRLGIVDASECPPTFGVPQGWVIGLIAGGDAAIRKAQEFAEDDPEQGWKDILQHQPTEQDTVIGLSASGTTPYVIGAVQSARANGLLTGCITCNENTPLAQAVEHPIVVPVGAEVLSGSTRLKAGTAQKMILNMISTAVMIRLGRVKGNRMVDMQLTNEKLIRRGTIMIMEATGRSEAEARAQLLKSGSVRAVLEAR